MARVTGIGGVFFKAKDPKTLAAWYRDHLGMQLEPFGGAILRWKEDRVEDGGLTVWHVAAHDSSWFPTALMVNYRVDDMDGMLAQLRAKGVDIAQGPEFHENGVFAWVVDPEGNRVELWEPKAWDEKNKR